MPPPGSVPVEAPRAGGGNSRGNAGGPADADLIARIAAAELSGRTTVADALARMLDKLRAERATSNVVQLQGARAHGKGSG